MYMTKTNLHMLIITYNNNANLITCTYADSGIQTHTNTQHLRCISLVFDLKQETMCTYV